MKLSDSGAKLRQPLDGQIVLLVGMSLEGLDNALRDRKWRLSETQPEDALAFALPSNRELVNRKRRGL